MQLPYSHYILPGIGTCERVRVCDLNELPMPDLDLIKQEEQGARDWRGRFARGRSGNPAGWPCGCRDHVNRAARLLLAGEGMNVALCGSGGTMTAPLLEGSLRCHSSDPELAQAYLETVGFRLDPAAGDDTPLDRRVNGVYLPAGS